MPQKRRKSSALAAQPLSPTGNSQRWLTQFGFILAIVLVIVRATLFEVMRSESNPVPGTPGAPSIPGPATGMFLDLLFCTPAAFVLARRLLDTQYTLRFGASHLIMAALSFWTLLSVLWAPDKFIAAVAAAHWVGALMLMWSVAQLVDSWKRLHIVSGVAFGLLLVLLVQGFYYRFIDLPDMQAEFKKDSAALLHARGADNDPVQAMQIAKNLESGEVTGFSLSRNTYAATLVLLGIFSAGLMIQRIRDKDSPAWWVPVGVVLLLSLLMLYRYVESKTAYATPFIGAAMLLAFATRRGWLRDHSRKAFWGGVSLFFLGVVAVVGHGLKHGTLLQQSLTYRWQYWVGAARVFVKHPLIGVGWANFGEPYLAVRLVQAIEQPKDPHNFLIRGFVELGIVGGLLTLAWILRMAWELTQPPMIVPESTSDRDDSAIRYRQAVAFIIITPIVAFAINALIAIDFTQRSEWVILELFKRAAFILAMITGLGLSLLRSMTRQEIDDRPAPWIYAALLVAISLFLLHNLIDFSMFEPGTTSIFALLLGAALGLRMPSRPRRPWGTAVVIAVFIAGGVGWFTAAGAGVWNVAQAETLSAEADELIRANGDSSVACQKYVQASMLVPINGEYAYRAAYCSAAAARQLLEKAIVADPLAVRYHRALAELDLREKLTEESLKQFAACVELDPNNMDLRIEYAEALAASRHTEEAKVQYEQVLRINDTLPAAEIQRLSAARLAHVRDAIAKLAVK